VNHAKIKVGDFIEDTFGKAQLADLTATTSSSNSHTGTDQGNIVGRGMAAHAEYGSWLYEGGEMDITAMQEDEGKLTSIFVPRSGSAGASATTTTTTATTTTMITRGNNSASDTQGDEQEMASMLMGQRAGSGFKEHGSRSRSLSDAAASSSLPSPLVAHLHGRKFLTPVQRKQRGFPADGVYTVPRCSSGS
jgi:hypothetical protein